MNEKIAALFKSYRTFENISSAELAERAGVSQGTISNIENGKFGKRKNSLETIRKVILAVGMPVSDDVAEYIGINADGDNFKESTAYKAGGHTHIPVTKNTFLKITAETFLNSTGLNKEDEDAVELRKQSHYFESDIIISTYLNFIDDHKEEIKQIIMRKLQERGAKLYKQYQEEKNNGER
ncbi:helix-turn-helix transcriptional regulator [Bacillus sp. FSL W7-1582]|uniref:helix-turn-helix transcriptional regulator n=1 Tax=Bacillus sp. FSL W7-1582 TaxID=2954566 RepID=UPI00315A892B